MTAAQQPRAQAFDQMLRDMIQAAQADDPRLAEHLARSYAGPAPTPEQIRDLTQALVATANVYWRLGLIDEAMALLRQIEPRWGLSLYIMSLHYVEQCSEDILLELRRRYAANLTAQPLMRAPVRRPIPTDRPAHVAHYVRTAESSAMFFLRNELASHDPERTRCSVVSWSDYEAKHYSDEQIFDDLVARNIDILVDHCDIMGGGKMRVLAAQPAPIILGRGGLSTSATPSIAWRLGDAVTHPPGCEPFWTERILRIPQMQSYAPPLDSPDPVWRAQGPIIFGAFCQPGKIQPATARVWARLLAAAPESQLLVKHGALSQALARERVFGLLAASGLPMERVTLQGATSHADHLAAYGRVDIVLDPFPFGGHTTLCEALWMGTPAVALLGETLPGRWSASYLTGAGCADWIAVDAQDYIAKALALVADRSALNARRQGLREKVAASPLCDGAAWARAMEAGYQHMVAAHNAAL